MANRPTTQELMDNLQLSIDNQRARMGIPKPRAPHPPEPTHFTTRNTLQEIDTVEICPAYPEYMVIGTYSLVKCEDEKDYAAQVRKGLLIVMPVNSIFTPAYPGQRSPHCDIKKFSCAVVDIHFHPQDETLLGVATSNAQIHFYRLIKHADVISRRVELKLIHLGSATITPKDEHGLVAVVTQFAWIDGTASRHKADVDETQMVNLVATTTFNTAILVLAEIPSIKTLFDARLAQEYLAITAQTVNLLPHTLEAWCVATCQVHSTENFHLFITGADDSAMIASLVTMTPMIQTGRKITEGPQLLFHDKKSHTAGVTSIHIIKSTLHYPNPTNPSAPEQNALIFTGSYDEHLRLFLYQPDTGRKQLVHELKLNGGVWRIKLMDSYIETPRRRMDIEGNPLAALTKTHYVFLVSVMHGGAKIVRFTHIPHYHDLPANLDNRDELVEKLGWTGEVVCKFAKEHESMVYACDFRKEHQQSHPGDSGEGEREKVWAGRYTVVSTSFYDMKVCVWEWVDEVVAAMAETEIKGKVEEKRRSVAIQRAMSSAGRLESGGRMGGVFRRFSIA